MWEVPLSRDGPLLIENTNLVLFRAPVDTNEPGKSLITHSISPPSHGPSRRLPFLYWRSEAQLPTGHPSWPNPPGHTSEVGAQSADRHRSLPAGRPAQTAYNASRSSASRRYRIVIGNPPKWMAGSEAVG